jgi:photosystem II protein
MIAPALLSVFALASSRLALQPARLPSSCVRMMAVSAEIQFIKGIDEDVVPDIKLTRSKDGMTGTATFVFDQPSFLIASAEPQAQGEITGMFMVDEEGEIATTDVNAKFINGKPKIVEAVFVMRDPPTWDRVMRFLERYAESHGLGFKGA